MPVGMKASPELMPTKEQREYIYHRLREVRGFEGGKEIFVMDFQNDGEYVGGCIAGGRNYCHINPKEDRQAGQICPVCQELLDYARLRSEKCPFMKEKTFCANCKVHCYKPEVREQIRQVMRFSGPRMLIYHPVLAVWHLICSKMFQIENTIKGW